MQLEAPGAAGLVPVSTIALVCATGMAEIPRRTTKIHSLHSGIAYIKEEKTLGFISTVQNDYGKNLKSVGMRSVVKSKKSLDAD